MKYLISADTNLIRQENAAEWGVEKVLVLGSDISFDLSTLPRESNPMTIYIPTVFDYTNSLSYDGVYLALRILMYYIRIGRTDIDIVLMGNESELNFLLHFEYPNILKIPGMHYIRFNREIVKSYQLKERQRLQPDAYRSYLPNLGLTKPSSFKSTHSLTNEWCLFKWSSFMGFNEDTSVLDSHPYFDFIITIEKLNHVRNSTASNDLKDKISKLPNARILLIDDKTGWHSFFQEMLRLSPNIELHCIGENFNKLEYTDIERTVDAAIKDFNPHVIILDFRLMEDKDAESDFNKISGGLLLKKLKGKFNKPGICYGSQILMFTATSRIENILRLKQLNADGFILKEQPEQYASKEITEKLIRNMVSDISDAISRAQFLMPINSKLTTLEQIVSPPANIDIKDIKEQIKTVSESVRLITQNNDLGEDILKLCYLNLFSILERLKPSSVRTIDKYVQDNAPNDITRGYWNNIDNLRNSLAHGDNKVWIGRRNCNISIDIIKEWTLLLCDFVNNFLNHKISSNC